MRNTIKNILTGIFLILSIHISSAGDGDICFADYLVDMMIDDTVSKDFKDLMRDENEIYRDAFEVVYKFHENTKDKLSDIETIKLAANHMQVDKAKELIKKINDDGGWDAWKVKVSGSNTKIINGKEYVVNRFGKNSTEVYTIYKENTIQHFIPMHGKLYVCADYTVKKEILTPDINLPEDLRGQRIGSDIYDDVFQRFIKNGNINKIESDWNRNIHPDNFDAFVANLKNDMTPEEAALNTHAGKNWAKGGYKYVEVDHETAQLVKDGIEDRIILYFVKENPNTDTSLAFLDNIDDWKTSDTDGLKETLKDPDIAKLFADADDAGKIELASFWKKLPDSLKNELYVLQLPEYNQFTFINDLKSAQLVDVIVKDPIYIDIWKIFNNAEVSDEIRQNKNGDFELIKKFIEKNKLDKRDYDQITSEVKKGWEWEGKRVKIDDEQFTIAYINEKKLYVYVDNELSIPETITYNKAKINDQGEVSLHEYLQFGRMGGNMAILIKDSKKYYANIELSGVHIYNDALARFGENVIKRIWFLNMDLKRVDKLSKQWVDKEEFKFKISRRDKEVTTDFYLVFAKSYTKPDLEYVVSSYKNEELQNKFSNDLADNKFFERLSTNPDLIKPWEYLYWCEKLPDAVRRGENGELEYLLKHIQENPAIKREQLIEKIKGAKSREELLKLLNSNYSSETKLINKLKKTPKLFKKYNELSPDLKELFKKDLEEYEIVFTKVDRFFEKWKIYRKNNPEGPLDICAMYKN